MSNIRRSVVASMGVFLAISVSGCGGTKSISGDKVASEVSSELTAKVGQKPQSVKCPELKAQKGQKVTCALTAGGKTYDTAVTVTSVDGSSVKFDIQVADTPK